MTYEGMLGGERSCKAGRKLLAERVSPGKSRCRNQTRTVRRVTWTLDNVADDGHVGTNRFHQASAETGVNSIRCECEFDQGVNMNPIHGRWRTTESRREWASAARWESEIKLIGVYEFAHPPPIVITVITIDFTGASRCPSFLAPSATSSNFKIIQLTSTACEERNRSSTYWYNQNHCYEWATGVAVRRALFSDAAK
ncbi:hypothetical protein BDZ97DRAFT_1767286 [Flammula alnicola]|nr:hypothetical protein BDZ97DRAFT_1767286 [Flammula alnicola]